MRVPCVPYERRGGGKRHKSANGRDVTDTQRRSQVSLLGGADRIPGGADRIPGGE